MALKIEDGATRASECAIAALLVRLGAIAADHPAAARRLNPPILSRRGARPARSAPPRRSTPAAPGSEPPPAACRAADCGSREAAMRRVFDMDDRARLPWRFHGRALGLFADG